MRLHLLFAALLWALVPIAAQAADITVFGAASLAESLNRVAADYQRQSGKTVTVSLAASSALAKQIEASGGADIFISADEGWMDYLDRKSLIDRASRKDLLSNRLVLVALPGTASMAIKPGFDLKGALRNGRLAMADPDSVPAGKYGREALTGLGVWDKVSGQVARAENVRVALAYVARGEAPLGIVYETDARAEPKVAIAGVFPANTHAPILYPVALTKDARPQARGFLAYLTSSAARAVFTKAGFTVK
jgi:molybdate transport system substrate-binding protein